MSDLPSPVRAALETALGCDFRRTAPLGGGMINQAARVETADGAIFVKWHNKAPQGLFTTEADGLCALQKAGAVRVPAVLAVSDSPAFLALKFIEEKPPRDVRAFARRFGEQIAAQHLAASDNRFGWPSDNYIGSLPQLNSQRANWPAFYRECRLLPQVEIARARGRLPATREKLLMAVIDNLENLLQGLDSKPSLLHGDLWSGNYLSAGDEPVILDPAAYHGEREMEIAFTELFGGFAAGFYEVYNATFPLQEGYEYRRPLHQLYPLLVHLNHFGEGYGRDVDNVCCAYL